VLRCCAARAKIASSVGNLWKIIRRLPVPLQADAVYIGPAVAPEPANITVLNNVRIIIDPDVADSVKRVVFWSGGTYSMWNGYSLFACDNINRIDKVFAGI
jgi:hypothetical protein